MAGSHTGLWQWSVTTKLDHRGLKANRESGLQSNHSTVAETGLYCQTHPMLYCLPLYKYTRPYHVVNIFYCAFQKGSQTIYFIPLVPGKISFRVFSALHDKMSLSDTTHTERTVCNDKTFQNVLTSVICTEWNSSNQMVKVAWQYSQVQMIITFILLNVEMMIIFSYPWAELGVKVIHYQHQYDPYILKLFFLSFSKNRQPSFNV